MTNKTFPKPHITINDDILMIEDLGDIADMPLADALQEMVKRGFMGEENVDKPWYEVVKSDSFKLEKFPTEDQQPEFSHYQDYLESYAAYRNATLEGLETAELKAEMLNKRATWKAVKKLSSLS